MSAQLDAMFVRNKKGLPLIRMMKRIVANSTSDCWLWTGLHHYAGYSVVSVMRKQLAVHRLTYELLKGPIPAGLEIDHLCRNRGCVNPAHLEAVTHLVNVHRGLAPAAWHAITKVCRKAGHPLSPIEGAGKLRGWRRCVVCKNAATRKRYATRIGSTYRPCLAGRGPRRQRSKEDR